MTAARGKAGAGCLGRGRVQITSTKDVSFVSQCVDQMTFCCRADVVTPANAADGCVGGSSGSNGNSTGKSDVRFWQISEVSVGQLVSEAFCRQWKDSKSSIVGRDLTLTSGGQLVLRLNQHEYRTLAVDTLWPGSKKIETSAGERYVHIDLFATAKQRDKMSGAGGQQGDAQGSGEAQCNDQRQEVPAKSVKKLREKALDELIPRVSLVGVEADCIAVSSTPPKWINVLKATGAVCTVAAVSEQMFSFPALDIPSVVSDESSSELSGDGDKSDEQQLWDSFEPWAGAVSRATAECTNVFLDRSVEQLENESSGVDNFMVCRKRYDGLLPTSFQQQLLDNAIRDVQVGKSVPWAVLTFSALAGGGLGPGQDRARAQRQRDVGYLVHVAVLPDGLFRIFIAVPP